MSVANAAPLKEQEPFKQQEQLFKQQEQPLKKQERFNEQELPRVPTDTPLLPVVRSMCDIGELPSRPAQAVAAKKKDSVTESPNDAGPDPAENGIIRSVTSPSLLTMASVLSSASTSSSTPRHPPLTRNTSEIKTGKKKIFGRNPPSPPRGGSPSTLIQRVGSFLGKKGGAKHAGTPGRSADGIPSLSLTDTHSTTDTSSTSGSPPSPGSRESTLMEAETRSESDSSTPTQVGRAGSSASDRADDRIEGPPKFGITWGPDFNEDGRQFDRQPRRSLSHNELRGVQPGFALGLVEMADTRSYRSAVGVGMKARRLSTALPNDFNVGYCELDEDYKSSSHIPGRRGKTIGLGATATVKLMYKCGDASGTYYAVKEFRKRQSNEETEEDYVKKIKSEYSVAASLEHPNIVKTFRLCTHHGRWNHVMEYCQYGELFHYYKNKSFAGQDIKDRLCIFKQVLRGVDYLHDHGIAHRDIKLENILMNAEGQVKITDFGVSEVFAGEHPGFRESGGKCGTNMVAGEIRRCAPGICGSFPYMAPEVIAKKGDYDPRPLDVWSCGIVYATMAFNGNTVWHKADESDPNYKQYSQAWTKWLGRNPDGEIRDGPDGNPKVSALWTAEFLGNPALKRLLFKMLNPNPDKRVTIKEALNSIIIKGVECCTPESYEELERIERVKTTDSLMSAKRLSKTILRKHSHVPPKEHKTPQFLKHRFDMGDGWR